MKKVILFVSCLAVLCFTSCKNESEKVGASDESIDSTNLVEETIVEEVTNESNIDFETAMAAYDNGDHATAAKYLDFTISDLTAESENLDKAGKEKMQASIGVLKGLAQSIQGKTETDTETLADVFAKAEMLVANNYLIISQAYFVPNPEKAKST